MELISQSATRLDKFLADSLPDFSRSRLAKEIEAGNVSVEGETVTKTGFRLESGDTVELEVPEDRDAHDLTPADIPLDVVFEDDCLLVVNKPRGLATHPAASLREPSLVNALLARPHSLSGVGAAYRPGIVHRLDKETTGLIVIAKTDAAHASLAKQIESKAAERRYVAVTGGELERDRFIIDSPIRRSNANRQLMTVDAAGKPARTHVKRLGTANAGTVVACRLETGRTHQIRVHLSAVNLPIVGDPLYAPRRYQGPPMQLHAAYLAFDHPMTAVRVETYAPPAEDWLGGDIDRAQIENW